MKHILFILIAFLCLHVPYLFAQPQPKNEYNHKFYSQVLNDHIYPMIRNHLKKYDRPLYKEESDRICDEVRHKVITALTKKNIPVVTPPDVYVLKITTDTRLLYVLAIRIVLYDIDESPPDFNLSLQYAKGFVIFLYDKNTRFTELKYDRK